MLLPFTVKQIFFLLKFKEVSKERAYGQKNITAVLPFFLTKSPRLINRNRISYSQLSSTVWKYQIHSTQASLFH